MTDSPTIALPPGTRAVRLELIPALLAEAKHPPKMDETDAARMLRAMYEERQTEDLIYALNNTNLTVVDLLHNDIVGPNRLFLNLAQMPLETFKSYALARGVMVEVEATTSARELVEGLVDCNG